MSCSKCTKGVSSELCRKIIRSTIPNVIVIKNRISVIDKSAGIEKVCNGNSEVVLVIRKTQPYTH